MFLGGVGRLMRALASGTTFSPASLFAAGEQGFWYDTSDLTTMFQDATGTVPAALEQPVMLRLDKSKGFTYGSNVITNGDFSSATGWTATEPASTTIGGGVCTFSSTTTGASVFQSVAAQGSYVAVTYTIVSITAGGFAARAGGQNSTTRTTPGTYTDYVYALSTGNVGIVAVGTTSGVIDNVSARLLRGNHAVQTTSANAPVLSARVNALVGTATLATQNVTTVATTYTLRFTGTGSITLSGTGSGTYSAGSHSVVCTAGTLTVTVTGSVTEADLRVASETSSLPAYQAVVTASNYDVTGFPYYLRYNGTNQWMQTAAIDFSGTDAVSLFAGVRKLSDAGRGNIVELTASADANNGAFHMTGPNAASATYAFESKGTALTDAVVSTGVAAPITSLLTGLADISADSNVLRVNGVQVDSDAGDQGTGNYANAVVYLGSRAGTSLWFNGRDYGLIGVGRAVTAAELAATESWLNDRVKISAASSVSWDATADTYVSAIYNGFGV